MKSKILGWDPNQWAHVSHVLSMPLVPANLARALDIQFQWKVRYLHEPLSTEIGKELFNACGHDVLAAVDFTTQPLPPLGG